MEKTVQEHKLARERALFAAKLFSVSANNLMPDLNDLHILFAYYKCNNKFSKESLHQLVADHFNAQDCIPVLAAPLVASLFSEVLRANKDLTEDDFVDLFAADFSLLHKLSTKLKEKNLFVQVERKVILLQLVLREETSTKGLDQTQVLEKVNSYLTNWLAKSGSANEIQQSFVVVNVDQNSLDFVVRFAHNVSFFELPPVFEVPLQDENPVPFLCKVYENEQLPLNKTVFRQEGVFDKFTKRTQAFSEELGVTEGLNRGKSFVVDSFDSLKSSGVVQSASEGLTNFWGGLKGKVEEVMGSSKKENS